MRSSMRVAGIELLTATQIGQTGEMGSQGKLSCFPRPVATLT